MENKLVEILSDESQDCFYRITDRSLECFDFECSDIKNPTPKWKVTLTEQAGENLSVVQDSESIYILRAGLSKYSKDDGKEIWNVSPYLSPFLKTRLLKLKNRLVIVPEDSSPICYDTNGDEIPK